MHASTVAQTPAETTSIRKSLPYRKDIDGLRSIAVLAVVGFHAGVRGLSGGFVGVDVFFVLSGYLICSIIVREIEQDTFSIARFYERRCKRILPALFAVLAFCMLAGLFLLSPVEAQHLGREVTATALSISNLHFYHQGNYFDHGGILSPLLMTWSLAVEEQFYLIFPLLMLLLYKRSKPHLFAILAAACALSLAASVYCEFRHPELNFYLLPTRAWEMGVGTLLAIWHAHANPEGRQPKWQADGLGVAGLLLILGSVTFYSGATRFPGYEAIPPVLGTILLLSSSGGIANRLLSLRPFVAVGLISYSLYLWHWPLLSFAATADSEHTSPYARAALVLVAAGIATLSFFFIEGPFRKAHYASRRRVLLVYASLLVAISLGGLAFSMTFGFAGRVPKLARVERSLELERDHECINFATRGVILTQPCVPAPSSSPVVALLGDSHAEAIEATLRRPVASAGARLLALTSYSCPPLQGFTRVLAGDPLHAQACAEFNKHSLAAVIQRPDVKLVVLIGSWAMVKEDRFVPDNDPEDRQHVTPQQSGANLVEGLETEVRDLEAAGKQVILLDDWPSLNFAPIDRLRYLQLPARRMLSDLLLGHPVPDPAAISIPRTETVLPAAEEVRKSLLAFAATDPRLQYIDTKQIVCTESQCDFSDGENLFYTDGNHMSRFGVEKILGTVDVAAAMRPRN